MVPVMLSRGRRYPLAPVSDGPPACRNGWGFSFVRAANLLRMSLFRQAKSIAALFFYFPLYRSQNHCIHCIDTRGNHMHYWPQALMAFFMVFSAVGAIVRHGK